jgi:outer membrane protein OmpA-like peptidoglycan-associated protein
MRIQNIMTNIYSLSLLFLLTLTQIAFGQFSVDTSYSINDVVNKVLLSNSSNLLIQNIKYTGSKQSIGVFDCNMKYNSIIKKGIIISTGYVLDVHGPNTSTRKGTSTFSSGDPELNELIRGQTLESSSLEFDFIATGDSISFNFFFASEEYPEYVNSNVNDVFAFFVTEKESGVKKNIALIPVINVPISVDNVNAKKNAGYYIENPMWSPAAAKEWTNEKQKAELSYAFQFDGLTRLIHASTQTKRGSTYHLKMTIADVGDRQFDSAIFIEAGSLKSNRKKGSAGRDGEKYSYRISGKKGDSVTVSLKIQFAKESSGIEGAESVQLLDKVYNTMKENPSMRLLICGHTDSTGSYEHNLQLSEQRAKNIAIYLQKKGIEPVRIAHKGYGSSRPVSRTDQSLNRRVDFIFKP